MSSPKTEPADPRISAVVVVRPPDQREEGAPLPQKSKAVTSTLQGLGISVDQADQMAGPPDESVPSEAVVLDRVKIFFTRNGFEVHAPLRMTFSIGGALSKFAMFGDEIVVDHETFPASVTVQGGGTELSLQTLPDDIRNVVASIHFPPSMDFPV